MEVEFCEAIDLEIYKIVAGTIYFLESKDKNLNSVREYYPKGTIKDIIKQIDIIIDELEEKYNFCEFKISCSQDKEGKTYIGFYKFIKERDEMYETNTCGLESMVEGSNDYEDNLKNKINPYSCVDEFSKRINNKYKK